MRSILHRGLRLFLSTFFPFKAFEEARNSFHVKSMSQFCSTQEGVQLFPESNIFNQNGANRIQIGRNSCIRGELLLFNYGQEIILGEHVYVGSGTRIWSGSRVVIGNNVLIAHNCNIIGSNSHETDSLSRAESFKALLREGHPRENPGVEVGEIIIEDDVWISFNVTVLKNVKIGEGAIIASDSLVLEDVAPYTLVGGYPAKLIKKLKD